MSKSGSSIHTGWSKESGTSTSRRRNGGRRCRRCSIISTMRSNEYPPDISAASMMITPVTCMCPVGVSV